MTFSVAKLVRWFLALNFAVRLHATLVEQVHIALGDNLSSTVVTFATRWQPVSPPFVRYSAGSLQNVSVSGVTQHFVDHNVNGTQWVHKVVLNNLPPRALVDYEACADLGSHDPTVMCAAPCRFTTLSNSSDWDPTLLIFGDLGRDGGSLEHRLFTALPAMEKEVAAGSVDAAIHMGDFAYDLHDEGGVRGDRFMNRIQQMASSVFYQTVPGNHEIIDGSFGHYRARFSMPHGDELGGFRMWYSMDIGKMHIVGLSTEVFFARPQSETDAMLAWLDEDLAHASANRRSRPWLVTVGHRPPYCSNADNDCIAKGSAGERVRAELESLLQRHSVDLSLWAHEHSYERTWPVFNFTVTQKSYVDAKAPVHIISGAAGCNEDHGFCMNPTLRPKGDWSAFRTGVLHPYSYGHLRAPNSTHLYVDQVNAQTGHVYDTLWLVKTGASSPHIFV